MMVAALEARRLTKRFSTHVALNALDLVEKPGEIVCLLGANGAGKTTTLNLLLGFLEPSDGQALVFGTDAWADPMGARRKLAYVPEMVALYPNLTGYENLEFFHALSQEPTLSRTAFAEHLRTVGFDPAMADRRVSGYSKGMRQKIALAGALARRAEAWLLDEPYSGLDPHAAAELTSGIASAAWDGAAVLMATHDLFRARELATRVGIMKAGQLVELLDPKSLDHAGLERIYLQHMYEDQAA